MDNLIFYFKADGDNLSLIDVKNTAYTGNMNSYLCSFELSKDWEDLTVFVAFTSGETSVTSILSEDNTCYIPYEVLQNSATVNIGLFANSASELNPKRLVTGFVPIDIEQGAYNEDIISAQTPSADMWELLLNKNIPIIGDNGNWYIWDIEEQGYVDSGHPSVDLQANPVDSVNSKTGVVVIDKSDVGLGNVDNTSDANKPISTATQNALNDKMNKNNPTGTGSFSLNRQVGSVVGTNSFAAGNNSIASGTYTFAVGDNVQAGGRCSYSEGIGTFAGSPNQHVQGKFNIHDSSSKYLHIVGDGTGDNNRRNGYTLDARGNGWYRNDVFCGGTDGDNPAHKLSEKQNATDNNLDTTAKTIVGAINEIYARIENLESAVRTLGGNI